MREPEPGRQHSSGCLFTTISADILVYHWCVESDYIPQVVRARSSAMEVVQVFPLLPEFMLQVLKLVDRMYRM